MTSLASSSPNPRFASTRAIQPSHFDAGRAGEIFFPFFFNRVGQISSPGCPSLCSTTSITPAAFALQEKCGSFSCSDERSKMQQAIEQRILSRIYGNGRGWAFSQADFADLGARSTIDSALHRREGEGVIRRIIRCIYDYPRQSKALGGATSPNIDQVAHALARKFAWRIQPDGATAQNLLGLSTQVPAHAVYLSDGPDRSYTIGRTKLAFEHTALKLQPTASITSSLFGSMTLTSVSLQTKVVMRMLDSGVRSFT